jgi:hypothetical protein
MLADWRWSDYDDIWVLQARDWVVDNVFDIGLEFVYGDVLSRSLVNDRVIGAKKQQLCEILAMA